MKLFQYARKEKGMWRGWLQDGQSLEFYWNSKPFRIIAELGFSKDDRDMAHRNLHLALGRFAAFIPLGITEHPWEYGESPSWGFMFSLEYDCRFYFGHWSYYFRLPWADHTLAYEKQLVPGDDSTWVDVFDNAIEPFSEKHPYRYTLQNGAVQCRVATIHKRRHLITWAWLRWLKIPFKVLHSIDVVFSGPVGEETGSWKGGCTATSHIVKPGETMLETLRRMEVERKF